MNQAIIAARIYLTYFLQSYKESYAFIMSECSPKWILANRNNS